MSANALAVCFSAALSAFPYFHPSKHVQHSEEAFIRREAADLRWAPLTFNVSVVGKALFPDILIYVWRPSWFCFTRDLPLISFPAAPSDDRAAAPTRFLEALSWFGDERVWKVRRKVLTLLSFLKVRGQGELLLVGGFMWSLTGFSDSGGDSDWEFSLEKHFIWTEPWFKNKSFYLQNKIQFFQQLM